VSAPKTWSVLIIFLGERDEADFAVSVKQARDAALGLNRLSAPFFGAVVAKFEVMSHLMNAGV
jgi:hypothetical protein